VSENAAATAFNNLQTTIFRTFGQRSPSVPILRCRNATQTSLVLEWDPIDTATASLRSLSLYRNGSKAGTIPRPTENLSTKISGLAVDTEYTFHLVLRTSAGTYASEKLKVRTHKMTELSGITVTPGIMPAALRESLQMTIEKIGAKIIDQVRIDTTHFVCTEGRGQQWEKALEMNVPVVVPDWVKGCEREGRIVGVRGYYLNADPRLRQVGPSVQQQAATQQAQQQAQQTAAQQKQQQAQQAGPRTEVTPPTPDRTSMASEEDEEESEDEKAPPPPPKSPTTAGPSSHPAEPKTATDEPKARMEDVKPMSPRSDDDDDDEESDDDTERGDEDEKRVEAGLPSRSRQESSPSPNSEKFEDVDL
jgi:chitin biosynthesis protein CHS5